MDDEEFYAPLPRRICDRVIQKMPEALLVGVITSAVASPKGPEAAIPLGILAFGNSLSRAVLPQGRSKPSSKLGH